MGGGERISEWHGSGMSVDGGVGMETWCSVGREEQAGRSSERGPGMSPMQDQRREGRKKNMQVIRLLGERVVGECWYLWKGKSR